MLNEYQKELALPAVYLDRDCRLGFYQAGLLLQDVVTELFSQYGCDALRMSASHGLVWAVVRTRFRFLRRPLWLEPVRLCIAPVKRTAAALYLEMTLKTLTGEPLLWGGQELCAIEAETHKLRRLRDTPLPDDLSFSPSVFPTRFPRMQFQLTETAFFQTVRTTDTDMNRHMNNVASLRLAVDAFPSSFWQVHTVEELNLHYSSETVEGQTIAVRRAQYPEGAAVQLLAGERTVVRAFFRFRTAEADS